MSVVINIGGVDKTSVVDARTLNVGRALTSQIDTASFDVIRKGGVGGGGYKPSILDTVQILDGSQVIFGGQIVTIESTVPDGSDIEQFHCTAKDYSYDMDRTLVIETYQDMTVDAIIADIKTQFLDSAYDITNVSCPVTINYIAFNYEYPSKCLQQLAELTDYDWYVDDDKKIYFFSKSAMAAPFNLTDTSENFYYNTLKLKSDLSNLRNTVIVRGGQYLGPLTAEKIVADGQAIIYKQGYQYNTVYVKVNNVSKTVGIDNIDDPTLFDCLYNFQEKFVRFPEASKPASTIVVEVGGYPYIPVIVKVQDAASVAVYGAYEFKIIDKSIDTRQGARDRGSAELRAWANTVEDGSFETMTSGLEVGQGINVSSTIRGVNQDYVISKITSTLAPNATQFLHKVTLMTTQNYGMVEFLQKLLMQKDKEIVIGANEVLEDVFNLENGISFADAVAPQAKTSPPYVWTSGTTTLIWNFGTWG